MDADIKKRWVEALRSGRYKQISSTLRRTEGFCCLGVLCDIVDPSGWEEGSKAYAYALPGWDRCSVKLLPIKIGEMVGLKSSQADELSSMNDKGVDFGGIASYIEANL